MKETIYTIPLNEAFDEPCECPLSLIESRLEKEAIEYTLGAAMMEPDFRIESNSKGYCNKHFSMLNAQSNKLSLALVLDTHLEEIRAELKEVLKTVSGKGGIFKKKANPEKLIEFLKKKESSCIVCDKIEHTMKRYIDIMLDMWKEEADFKKKLENSKGMCLPHYKKVVLTAQKKLSNSAEFIDMLTQKQLTELERIQEDIHKFTLKFDYRNKDMQWGTAKDAPIRTIEKISGDVLKFELK